MGKTSRYELIVIKAEEKDISDIYQIGTVSFSDAWREETIRNDMKGGHSCYFIAKLAKNQGKYAEQLSKLEKVLDEWLNQANSQKHR